MMIGIVLERICPEQFTWLRMMDKPDLQDKVNDIGVEVTKDFNPEQEEVDKLCLKIENGEIRNQENAEKTILEKYKKNGMVK